jgi:hypothetical protein
VNILIVSRDNIFILRIFSGLLIYTFILFYLINNASTFPKFIIEINHWVWWEKYKDASGSYFTKLQNR